MAKLWETSPQPLDPGVEAFLSSLSVDSRLAAEDIEGSLAHAAMLGSQGILPEATTQILVEGLRRLLSELEAGSLAVDPAAEDIHSFVEAELTARLGDPGRSLHAGRSRNDQVALDLRLRLRKESRAIRKGILKTIGSILDLATEQRFTVMPGYTHLQRAQPVSFAHHLLAWAVALERDYGRFRDAEARADECPLGACALAGTGLPISREESARLLGFARPTRNSMDTVGDRDQATEFTSACAILAMHLSRYGEEICLWASQEFGFVELSSRVSTGSSVMPQKRNPDPAELIRGKAGRAYGALINLLVVQKGLPLAYDRDLQEDKAAVLDAAETARTSVEALGALVDGMRPRPGRMRAAAEDGCLWAADAAEFLVLKGLPFRTAYAAGKALVEAWRRSREAREEGQSLSGCMSNGGGESASLSGVPELLAALGEDGLPALHPAWKGIARTELAAHLDLEACIARRDLPGGPAPARTAQEIERLRGFIAEEGASLDG